MKRIAIIPARGGSKRIPNKNIKDFSGKPIITYSIEAAIKSELYDEVMVSTDDEAIRNIALELGAKVPFIRSKENSNDWSTTFDVLEEVFSWYKHNGLIFQEASCIYPCAPFLSASLLKKSFELLIEDCDCVFPVLPYSHPIQRALEINLDGKIVPFFSNNDFTRTQDLKQSYFDAGMFYTFDVTKLLSHKSLRTVNSRPIVLNELCAHDIDNIDDWKIAELKFKINEEI